MKHLLLLAFLVASLFVCGQDTPNISNGFSVKQDSIVYLQKCIAFIKEIKQKELSDTNFILADKPFSFEYFDCLKELMEDSTAYTTAELSFIKNRQYPLLTKWTRAFYGTIRLISSVTINEIFKDPSKWWPYFNKNIGREFNTFSVPIFLRNYSYCLFYSDHHCGGLCGGGRLILYKKENNKWIELKSYCIWVI
jgi:hypothetical protein